MFDVKLVQRDFPILSREIHGHRLVYLDNAATTQKPRQVIEALTDYYTQHNANIHRGIHILAEEATRMYEAAREKVRAFIHARSTDEIIFVRNDTEALNLVAFAWALHNLEPEDHILLTEMEHHANQLPWQRAARQLGVKVDFIPVTDDGLLHDEWRSFFHERTRLVALSHASNVLGAVNPVQEIVSYAHSQGAVVVVDGAQSVPHLPVDVRDLDVDFLAFSGHKMLGPTGVGVLYGKRERLDEMEPYLLGGEMIREVDYETATWNDLPWKFEAGTPDIAGAIGLGAAIDYVQRIGMKAIMQHDQVLTQHLMQALEELGGVQIYGPGNARDRSGLVSFNLDGIHAHDVASLLDREGIAVRSGHHCAQPLAKKLGIPASVRASFYLYNDADDVARLLSGLKKVREVLRG